MLNLSRKTAVILFNLGGPKNLESVEPFLFNLFNDKAIIGLPQPFRFLLAKLISSRRAEKSQKIYAQINNKSPLLDITISQAHSLERELSFLGDFKVFVCMRYAEPFSDEVVDEVLKYNPTDTILLPLYPQFSTTTSASSLEDFNKKFIKAQKKNNLQINSRSICCYPVSAEFIKSHTLLIKQTLLKLYDGDLAKFRFLFSAHGLPEKVINAGDPYVFQVEQTTKKVVENLAQILEIDESKIDFRVCYQSKVGPLKWTGPSLDFEIRKIALDKKIPVIVPIAFVSDHSETLVELDIDYKNLAASLGVKDYLRVPALNTEGHFIKALTEICKIAYLDLSNERKSQNNGHSDSQIINEKPARICPKKFVKCPNKNFCQS
ncbi:MAG: ferrochelatase [Proteobacteria bacterium]|nr:ferrochelatase [Pseudomonadota bacterium]